MLSGDRSFSGTGSVPQTAAPPERPWERLTCYVISTIIIIILGMQTIVGFVGTSRWGWPIIRYDMYMATHRDGDRLVYNTLILAVLEDGSSIEITAGSHAKNFGRYKHLLASLLNRRLDALEPFLDEYCKMYDEKIIALKALDSGVAIGRNGPVYGLSRAK